MKSGSIPRLIGHACSLAAGASLAWWSLSSGGQAEAAGAAPSGDALSSSSSDQARKPTGKAAAASAGQGRDGTSTVAERSRVYREAWAELLHKKIPHKDLRALQRKLLAEWVEIDPEAAIQAALNERLAGSRDGVDVLLSAFAKKIREQPLLFWPMIQEKRFGFGTVFFRSQWMSVVGKSDPDLLFSYFGDFTPKEKEQAMGAALRGLKGSPGRIEAMTKHLSSLPDTPENRGLWQKMGEHLAWNGRLEDLAKGLSEAKTTGEEGIYLTGMATMAGRKYIKLGELRGTLDAMPEAVAEKAELAILKKRTMWPDAMADIASRMIEREDWDALQKEIPIRLHQSVPSREMDTFLGWAAELPERSETEDLYRCAIRNHINGDPAKARDWIEAMPAGWKRDNALVEYVNSSLHSRKDPDAAAWAMERIESEHFLGTAEEMKSGWDHAVRK